MACWCYGTFSSILQLNTNFAVWLIDGLIEVLSKEGEENLEEMVCKITNSIQESTLDTAGRHREQKNEKHKTKTKHMLKRKGEMIAKGIP